MNRLTSQIAQWINTKATTEELNYLSKVIRIKLLSNVDQAIIDHIQKGELLAAVKLHKNLYGSSLRESKDYIVSLRDKLSQ